MDIDKVLTEYDAMFGVNSLEEIEAFLSEKISEAEAESDNDSKLTLLNEQMGFYRDISKKEKCLECCKKNMELLDEMGLAGTAEYATSLLNVANAYRAFGLHNESLEYHKKVEEIFLNRLPENAFAFASLYNNWSLLYQEMGEFENAARMLKKAKRVVDLYKDAKIEQATTRTNLAATLLALCKNEDYDDRYNEAIKYLEEALAIFEADGGKNSHYSAALATKGDALYMKKDFGDAASYYKRSMEELFLHVGKTDAYMRVEEKYNMAIKQQDVTAKEDLKDNQREEIEKNDIQDKQNNEKTQQDDLRPCRVTDKQIRVKDKTNIACKQYDLACISGKFKNNLDRCEAFYEKYGVPMIHEKYSEYEGCIAVGMVGDGSDCFGFDDDISTDHDYGLGFCMWLDAETFEKIGSSLQNDYEELLQENGAKFLKEHGENETAFSQEFLSNRRGVFEITAFYENILGLPYDNENLFILTEENKLALAVNGRVFRDDEGVFTKIRQYLKSYYPEKIWRYRLAEKLHDFSQYAQSNYARMMARKDYVTSGLCISKGVESAMDIAYILNRQYAPYYKWKRKGMETLPRLKQIIPLLDKISTTGNQSAAWENYTYSADSINKDDEIITSFELVAMEILNEIKRQNAAYGDFSDDNKLESEDDLFLEKYVSLIAGEKRNLLQTKGEEYMLEKGTQNINREALIKRIVKHEWKQFDKTKNEGGRADCQDNWNTFSIMRKSQYMAWNDDLLSSYLNDLLEAENAGWNLITEKYARMMESTAPDKYAELKDSLPKRSEKRLAIQEEIIKIQVGWMEEFAKKYPKLSGNARVIHTSEDTEFSTSYETYLRGELYTYSENTLMLYGRYIVDLSRKNKNLAYMIMENTVHLYGYESVDEAEKRM